MKPSSDVLGLCIVGTGAIAARHAAVIVGDCSGFALEWVVGRELPAADRFANQWKSRSHGTVLSEALDDPKVDVVLIASPSQLHVEQAIQALRAGKHVIVEIPLALCQSDAVAIRECAKGAKRRVFVCHTLRAAPGLREVRRRAISNELRISHVSGYFGIPRRQNQSAAGQRNWVDNLLWHHGCHQVDATWWVMGFPHLESAVAVVGRLHPEFQMALDVGILCRAADGRIATHALSYNVEQPHWKLRFIGDDDVLTLQNDGLYNERDERLADGITENDVAIQDHEIAAGLRTAMPSEFDLQAVFPAIEVLARAQQFIDCQTPTGSNARKFG